MKVLFICPKRRHHVFFGVGRGTAGHGKVGAQKIFHTLSHCRHSSKDTEFKSTQVAEGFERSM